MDTKKRNSRQYVWQSENRDRINLIFTKGIKEKVSEAAEKENLSMSQFVEKAVLEKIERMDNQIKKDSQT